MVEFTEDEERRYQERVKFREDKARREAEAAAKSVQEDNRRPAGTGMFKSKLGKGLADKLTQAADKAENTRAKYNYIKGQAGRIGKAISPNNGRAAQRGVKVVRKPIGRVQRRSKARYPTQTRYTRPPSFKPSYDPLNDLIHGSQQGSGARRTSDHINDLTGASPGSSSAFFNDIMGHGGKKKRGGRDPFKDLLG